MHCIWVWRPCSFFRVFLKTFWTQIWFLRWQLDVSALCFLDGLNVGLVAGFQVPDKDLLWWQFFETDFTLKLPVFVNWFLVRIKTGTVSEAFLTNITTMSLSLMYSVFVFCEYTFLWEACFTNTTLIPGFFVYWAFMFIDWAELTEKVPANVTLKSYSLVYWAFMFLDCVASTEKFPTNVTRKSCSLVYWLFMVEESR